MYRGEAIFFAKFDGNFFNLINKNFLYNFIFLLEGNWKFGIKDLNLARGLGQGLSILTL